LMITNAMLVRMMPGPVPTEASVGATIAEMLDFFASIVGSIA
jgi:hypothetical protein